MIALICHTKAFLISTSYILILKNLKNLGYICVLITYPPAITVKFWYLAIHSMKWIYIYPHYSYLTIKLLDCWKIDICSGIVFT